MDRYFRLEPPKPYEAVLAGIRGLGDSLFNDKPLEWEHANAGDRHLFPPPVLAYHEMQLDIERSYTARDLFRLQDGRGTVVTAATAQLFIPAGTLVHFALLRFTEDLAVHPVDSGRPKHLVAYTGNEDPDPVLAEAIRAHFEADLGVLVPRLSQALGTTLTRVRLQRNGP